MRPRALLRPVEDDLERLRELADHCRTRASVLAAGNSRDSLQQMAEELDCHVVEVERERRRARGQVFWAANDASRVRVLGNSETAKNWRAR
jgi:hypothetical protein